MGRGEGEAVGLRGVEVREGFFGLGWGVYLRMFTVVSVKGTFLRSRIMKSR